MKRGKRYEFSYLGYVKMLWDVRQEKIARINSITSIAVIIVMFALGVLSKELFIIMLVNAGIGKATSWLVG